MPACGRQARDDRIKAWDDSIKLTSTRSDFGFAGWGQRVRRRPNGLVGARVRLLRHNQTVEKLDRITVDIGRMNGEPCIRDLRLTVRRVLEALVLYPDRAELKREYPELEEEDIRQALTFAAALVDDKVVPLRRADEAAARSRPCALTFLCLCSQRPWCHEQESEPSPVASGIPTVPRRRAHDADFGGSTSPFRVLSFGCVW
jgi:uncharacterized protein (DUF433 family)